MLKRIFTAIVLIVICIMQTVSASTIGVELTSGAQLYTDKGFLVDVNLSFLDPTLYSEDVYISYRILSESNEVLVSENPQTPIILKEDDTAFVTVEIKCSDLQELDGVSVAKIQFDLVDRANGYWFSDRGLIYQMDDPVLFERARLGSGLVQGEKEENLDVSSSESDMGAVMETKEIDPIPVLLNALIWILMVVLILRTIFKRKFNNN